MQIYSLTFRLTKSTFKFLGRLRAKGENPFLMRSAWWLDKGRVHSHSCRSMAAKVRISYIAKLRAGHCLGPAAKGSQTEKLVSSIPPTPKNRSGLNSSGIL